MRDYVYKPIAARSYEENLLKKANPMLIRNFNKVAKWVAENCPKLNGEFRCEHNPYYWIQLVVENGKAYLEYGDHGYSFSLAMSMEETATMATGSCQRKPYAFKGIQFFRNDKLEEFLKQWSAIKRKVIAENSIQSNVYSDDFTA